jgi:hypothetical protein
LHRFTDGDLAAVGFFHAHQYLEQVDLPMPLAPMIPTMLPLGTVKLTLSNNSRSP